MDRLLYARLASGFSLLCAMVVAFALVFIMTPSTESSNPTVLVSYGYGHGTGVYIGERTVITNRHVADNTIKVYDEWGVNEYEVESVDLFPGDVAFITLKDEPSKPAASLSCEHPATPGEAITHEGFPELPIMQRFSGSVTSVRFSPVGFHMDIQDLGWELMQFLSIKSSLGSSGGGVFRAGTYNMVGMYSGMYQLRGPIYLELMIPSSKLCEYRKALDDRPR